MNASGRNCQVKENAVKGGLSFSPLPGEPRYAIVNLLSFWVRFHYAMPCPKLAEMSVMPDSSPLPASS